MKRVRFQVTCSPLNFHANQRAEAVSPGRTEAGTGDASVTGTEPHPPRDLSAFLVKNNSVVFHSVRERRVRRASQEAPASVYKLDSKVRDRDAHSVGERQQFRVKYCGWV